MINFRIILFTSYLCVILTPIRGYISSEDETIGGLPINNAYLKTRQLMDKRVIVDGETLKSQFKNHNTSFSISLVCKVPSMRFIEDTPMNEVICNMSYKSNQTVLLSLSSDYTVSVKLISPLTLKLPPSNGCDTELTLSIQSKQVGMAYIMFHTWFTTDKLVRDTCQPKTRMFENFNLTYISGDTNLAIGLRQVVVRETGLGGLIFRIGLILLIVIVTFLMGCELDLKVLTGHLRKPIGPLIGMTGQFVFMPLIALGLAMVCPIHPSFKFGLFVAGCCPGGGASNVWTKLLNGDLNLSFAMTLISSISAIFMMPLLIFIFSPFFRTINLRAIPYGVIVVQLLYIFIPVIAGLLVRQFRPQLAKKLQRGSQPMAVVFLLHVIIFGSLFNLSIYSLMARYPLLLIVAASLPWIGFLFGFVISVICRQPWPVRKAIAVETGVQNSGIGILIMIYAIPQPDGDLGAVMPIIVSMATPLPLIIITSVLRIIRCKEASEKSEKDENCNEQT